MKKMNSYFRRIGSFVMALVLVVGFMPTQALQAMAASLETAVYTMDNGYLQISISENGGFGIRTLDGSRTNKADNDRNLVFLYDEDNTSFASFQVTRDGVTKEYVFGGQYAGSSAVTVSKTDEALVARWSVDGLTFTQSLSLVASGSNEHGMTYLSYTVENAGESAQVKCRILMDTSLGYQDYAYYNVNNSYINRETQLDEDGYTKAFYAMDDTGNPSVLAYTVNASIDGTECSPYRTVFAHWGSLASTVFDYTIDPDMTFSNSNNVKHMTSDSAYAQYFDLGTLASGTAGTIGTNYGVYSNEQVEEDAAAAINLVSPDVMQFASGSLSQYENGGRFSIQSFLENIDTVDYEKIRIMVYTTGGIQPVDMSGQVQQTSYSEPYWMELLNFSSGTQKDITWNFVATPQEVGQYAKVTFRVYDVSDSATQNTGAILQENLLGENSCYILCPGTVEKVPAIKFTGSSPQSIYVSGTRTLCVTGDNFSILEGELAAGSFTLTLSRADGGKIGGQQAVTIPASQIQVDSSTNVMTILLTDDMPGTLTPGLHQLTVDYTDTARTDFTGPALQFQVSDDVQYRSESYSYLAVIKDPDLTYHIRNFSTEEDFWAEVEAGLIQLDTVLLQFQGVFNKDPDASVIRYTGLSMNASDNVMTLNGCLDIRSGTVVITQNNGSVTVDFDADIYTTGAGTKVWSGVCALTELEAGVNHELIPYDEEGERQDMEGETITLLWPYGTDGLQNLMGLLFQLRYGELGVMEHPDASTVKGSRTGLVAFGAAMDLSFLIPDASVSNMPVGGSAGTTQDILGSSWDAAEHNTIKWSADEIRALNKQADYRSSTVNTDATPEDVDNRQVTDPSIDDTSGYNSASIVVDDILFGGQYLGLNLAVALGIPPYITGMPALEVLLEVDTIGDWSFLVGGQTHYANFSMQVEIEILSKNDIPIPNTIKFFVGGFTPGINIDGVGVLWLQGGGGGIDNLYETIFLEDSIPPLTLILQAQFSVLQVVTAVAEMGVGLRGFDISLSNTQWDDYVDPDTGVVTSPTTTILIDSGLSLYWYPEFYFMGMVNVNLAMAIDGGGYIVADETGFFEFFLRASVHIPGDIPIIGGITVGSVHLGANTDKLWGQISHLGTSLGVTFHWDGGTLDWTSGSKVYPTYPELLGIDEEEGMMALALDTNDTTGQVLVMTLGSNASISATTLSGIRRTAVGDTLKTQLSSAALHQLTLANNGCDRLLTIQWKADSPEQAQAQAAQIQIRGKQNSANQYPLQMLDPNYDADAFVNAHANSHLTYDEKSGTATLTVSFTEDSAFGVDWVVYTPEGAALVLYNVEPMPELTVDSAAVSADGASLSAQVTATEPNSFDNLTFFAEGEDSSYLLCAVEQPFAKDNSQFTILLPGDMASGSYTLRVVGSDEDQTIYDEAQFSFTYQNPNQPDPLAQNSLSAKNAGDYQVSVSVSDRNAAQIDGYEFTVVDAAGSQVSGAAGLMYYKDGSAVSYDQQGVIQPSLSQTVADSFTLGGHYEYVYTDEGGRSHTLTAGMSAGDYTVYVRRWKQLSSGAVVYSEPRSVRITVTEPVKTQLTVSAAPDGKLTLTRGDGTSYTQDVYTSGDISLSIVSAAERFTGSWELDGRGGQLTGEALSHTLKLEGLSDGSHLLQFVGNNQYGDQVSVTYQFTVDTVGPRLLLGAPVNGALFDYWTGELIVQGVTDDGAILTVTDNTTGKVLVNGVRVTTDETGVFTQTLALDPAVLNHTLTIAAADAAGNVTTRTVSVMSNGLGSIEELRLYANGKDVTNTKLVAGDRYELTLMAKLKTPAGQTGQRIVALNQPGMVDWTQTVVDGESSLTDTQTGSILTTALDSEGMVTGSFLVNSQGAYTVCASFGASGQVSYTITSGSGQSWQKGTQSGLSFTTDGDADQLALVLVDGLKVDEDDFTRNAATGTITLSAPFLEALSVGEHSLMLRYTDGDAEGSFTVTAAPQQPDPTPDPGTNPDTGDAGMLGLWMALAALSAGLLVLLNRGSRKRGDT